MGLKKSKALKAAAALLVLSALAPSCESSLAKAIDVSVPNPFGADGENTLEYYEKAKIVFADENGNEASAEKSEIVVMPLDFFIELTKFAIDARTVLKIEGLAQ